MAEDDAPSSPAPPPSSASAAPEESHASSSSSVIAAAQKIHETVDSIDPFWPMDVPAGQNPAPLWLHLMASVAPPAPRQYGAQGLLMALVCSDLKMELVQPGHLVCSVPVKSGITNRYRTLHGGSIATLVSIIGCAAIKTLAGSREGTVTDIGISYISSVPVNEEVEMESKVLKIGKNIAMASVDVCNKASRQLAAQGRVTMCFTRFSKL